MSDLRNNQPLRRGRAVSRRVRQDLFAVENSVSLVVVSLIIVVLLISNMRGLLA